MLIFISSSLSFFIASNKPAILISKLLHMRQMYVASIHLDFH